MQKKSITVFFFLTAFQGAVNRMEQVSRSAATSNVTQPLSKLSKNPKDLWTLWKKFEFGTGGGKATIDYSCHRRGANKCLYSVQKVFWDVVKKMISNGHTSDSAIDQIYLVYGRGKSNSNIIKELRTDTKVGIDRLHLH